MPFRRLPNSRPTRLQAFETARLKFAASSSSVILITPAQGAQLDLQNPASLYSRYKKETGEVGPARAIQISRTTDVDLKRNRLRLLVSHGYGNIQEAIARGDLPADVRPFYNIPASQETVPTIVTDADVSLWAGRFLAGETARLASGIPAYTAPGPIAWPSAAQITTARDACEQAEILQTQAKDLADTEDEQATALDPEVDTFIKDMWDTIEFNLRTHDGPSLRRRAREWGVYYATRPGEADEEEESSSSSSSSESSESSESSSSSE